MAETVKDLVCGMDVDPQTAAAKSEYQGQRNLSIGLRHLVRKITEPPPGSRPEPDWVG